MDSEQPELMDAPGGPGGPGSADSTEPTEATEPGDPTEPGDASAPADAATAAGASEPEVRARATEAAAPERPAPPPRDRLSAARQRAIEEPQNVEARLDLARLYRDLGETMLALEQLEAARAQEPDNVDVLVELASSLVAVSRGAEAERDLVSYTHLTLPTNREV